jgi:progressive ankylosis protein
MTQDLTQKKIFIFWFPLAATWLMMAFEGPFLAAIIARMSDVKYNLAAYGVAYSFALLSEAPVIMMMAASTALVKNYKSYLKLRAFNMWLIVFVSVVLAISQIPTLFNFIILTVMNLSERVAHLIQVCLLLLLPWPGAICYRRFLQGILIANNKTRMVSYGTVIRLFSMSATALSLFFFSDVQGAYVGALSLSAGVVMEALASHFMARGVIKRLKENDTGQSSTHLDFKEIFNFYYPLALAAFIGFGAHPMIAFFIGHSRMALESLAVLPVINALIFVFRSIGLSYQEVNIALIGDNNEGYPQLRKFALRLGLSIFGVLGFILYSPMSEVWFKVVSGLSDTLTELARFPARLLVIIPSLTVLIVFQRAIQVVCKKTKAISHATAIEVSMIALVLFVLIYFNDMVGILATSFALIAGRICSNVFLYFQNKKALASVKLT